MKHTNRNKIRLVGLAAGLLLLLVSVTAFAACTSPEPPDDPDVSDGGVPTESGDAAVTDSGTGAYDPDASDTSDTSDTSISTDDASGDPTVDTTVADAEDVTLGEIETLDPDAAATPPSATYPEGPLIGDGVETEGPYATFSKTGGVYTDTSFEIELTAPEGYYVRYTTDGSMPKTNSTRYSSPIKFTQSAGKAKVIRAACFSTSSGKLTGQVITQTYVTANKTTSLTYTIMISTDESNLNAMYADVDAKVERAAHVEIVAPDGTRVISQDAGLRLFGGSSRALSQKSFKIIARKNGYFGTTTPYVGAGTFTYPFFPERVVMAGKNAGYVLDKFDGLVLRNGGNDSLLATAEDAADACLLRDGIANEFVHKYAPNVGASLSHFAAVYLNGEYYGILEMRENQNEDYVKRIWGVLDDDVVVVKSELDTSRSCANHENGGSCRFCGVWFYYETDNTTAAQKEMADWIALCKKAAGAVNANESTYRSVYNEIASKVDLQNIKEYVAISCYLCNKDWPYNNVRVWRYTGAPIDGVAITDGKWRFATRDMDMTMGRYSSPEALPDLDSRAEVDMFEWVFGNYVGTYGDQPYPDALYLQGLFSFLLRDDTFRAEFDAYCRSLCSSEAKAYLNALYDDAYAQVKPIVHTHINRWKDPISADGGASNLRAWMNSAARVESFIQTRPAIFLEQLDKLMAMYK